MEFKEQIDLFKGGGKIFLRMWGFWMQYYLYGDVSFLTVLLYRLCKGKCTGCWNHHDGVENFRWYQRYYHGCDRGSYKIKIR